MCEYCKKSDSLYFNEELNLWFCSPLCEKLETGIYTTEFCESYNSGETAQCNYCSTFTSIKEPDGYFICKYCDILFTCESDSD